MKTPHFRRYPIFVYTFKGFYIQKERRSQQLFKQSFVFSPPNEAVMGKKKEEV